MGNLKFYKASDLVNIKTAYYICTGRNIKNAKGLFFDYFTFNLLKNVCDIINSFGKINLGEYTRNVKFNVVRRCMYLYGECSFEGTRLCKNCDSLYFTVEVK